MNRRATATSVLVYHIGSLGDTLMAAPALWALRAHWPAAHVALLTKRTQFGHVVLSGSLFEGAGLFDEVLHYPGSRYGDDTISQRLQQIGLLLRLRARRFDAVVYLAPSERQPAQVSRDEHFFRLAGIPMRVGFAGFPEPPSRTRHPLPELPTEAQALLERLRGAGIPVPPLAEARRDLGLDASERAAVDAWRASQPENDGGRRWLALGPGSNMPAKLWPSARLAAVAAALVDEFDLWPVVFGGPEDEAVGATLVRDLGRGYNAAGALAPRAAAAAMRACAAYVGNDTGTMHLAASEGVPCVAVFSARDFPGKWHPIGVGHRVIRLRPDCEGCMLERCEQHAMRCLLDIGVAEVLAAARETLARRLAAPTAARDREARATP
ncbi:MAG: glycosyltransferase family 9 protein [Rhizobacter sp.]|nr:glycosyltransferase family 9 protein [Rhizobacter sp.]